jgi:ABC-type multidrug transport system fused ATPase/permease subunit
MNGRIQQQGRHDELVAAKGLYRELCEAQFGEILVRLSK